MGLITGNTNWYFLLPSSGPVVFRHLCDIMFGVAVLRTKGVRYQDIYFVIENASQVDIDGARGLFGLEPPVTPVVSVKDFPALLQQNTAENAVIFVNGHGNEIGLDSKPVIQAFPFYKNIFETPNLHNAVVVFGQCFAGNFNYVSLADGLNIPGNNNATVIALGSSGFNKSISVTKNIGSGVTWDANIFLFYLFLGIFYDKDIDGDSKVTVMDIFKYSSLETHNDIVKIYSVDFDKSGIKEALEKLEHDELEAADKDKLEVDIKAFKTRLELRHDEQTPWILNANPASKCEI